MATKYPIILVHGIFMKPRFFHVFRHIKEKLTEAGYKVYVADTDGVGSIETNILQLKEQILQILENEGTEKINVIAHSKGGLETFYMIENLGMGDKIASVTTLSTPYRGSAVAGGVTSLPSPILSAFIFVCNTFYKILGDKQPDLRASLNQLCINDSYENKDMSPPENIYCQSYS